MKAKKALPAKLSDLIRVAVNDLTVVERSKKYKVDMGDWHSPVDSWGPTGQTKSACHVCFAGVVIAKQLGGDINEYLDPHDFPGRVTERLYALDAVRTGDVLSALDNIGASDRKRANMLARTDIPKIPKYSKRNSPIFKAALRKLARILREEGL